LGFINADSSPHTQYTLPGIDVETSVGDIIGSPFGGEVFVTGDEQVTISPADFFLRNKKVSS